MKRKLILYEDIVIGLLVASTLFLFSIHLDSHFTLPKIAVFSFLMFALIPALLIRIRIGDYRVLPRSLRFPLLLLVLWWLLGTSQSMHLQTALEGQYGRYNGLYTNLLLVILFTVLACIPCDLARLRRLFRLLALMMLFVCLYAFVQYIGVDPIFNNGPGARPVSSIGNPVALAVVVLLTLPFVVVEAIRASSTKQRVNFAFTGLLFIITLLVTGSRGPLLVLIGAVVVSGLIWLAMYFRSGNRVSMRVLSLLVLGCLLLVGSAVYLKTSGRLTLGPAFQVRFVFFDVALEMIKDTPMFGYGFESFRAAYPIYRPPVSQVILDAYKDTVVTPTMVHNDYLQLAVDNGLPAAVFYLIFVGVLVWILGRAIRLDAELRMYHIAILVMLLAYLMQGMSGWPEAASLIMFWLLLGVGTSFALGRLNIGKTPGKGSVTMSSGIAGSALLFTLACTVIYGLKVVQDFQLRSAESYAQSRRPDIVDDKLAWLGGSTSRDVHYQDRIGLVYMDRLQRSRSIQDYHKARKFFLKSRELNSYDPYVRFHIIQADSIAMRTRLIAQPSKEALEEMKGIIRMDPNNRTVYQVRAEFFLAMGKIKAARRELQLMRQMKKPG